MLLRELFNEFPVQDKVVPLAIQKLLAEPLDVSEDWARAEQLLLTARAVLPDRVEVCIALYKLYAYSNRFDEALALIASVLEVTATRQGFSADWSLLEGNTFTQAEINLDTRAYLYTLKAMAFVRLRQGAVQLAQDILLKLAQLDPKDHVGSSVLLDITQRLLNDDYEFVA